MGILCSVCSVFLECNLGIKKTCLYYCVYVNVWSIMWSYWLMELHMACVDAVISDVLWSYLWYVCTFAQCICSYILCISKLSWKLRGNTSSLYWKGPPLSLACWILPLSLACWILPLSLACWILPLSLACWMLPLSPLEDHCSNGYFHILVLSELDSFLVPNTVVLIALVNRAV